MPASISVFLGCSTGDFILVLVKYICGEKYKKTIANGSREGGYLLLEGKILRGKT
jgi:hypothetical protein